MIAKFKWLAVLSLAFQGFYFLSIIGITAFQSVFRQFYISTTQSSAIFIIPWALIIMGIIRFIIILMFLSVITKSHKKAEPSWTPEILCVISLSGILVMVGLVVTTVLQVSINTKGSDYIAAYAMLNRIISGAAYLSNLSLTTCFMFCGASVAIKCIEKKKQPPQGMAMIKTIKTMGIIALVLETAYLVCIGVGTVFQSALKTLVSTPLQIARIFTIPWIMIIPELICLFGHGFAIAATLRAHKQKKSSSAAEVGTIIIWGCVYPLIHQVLNRVWPYWSGRQGVEYLVSVSSLISSLQLTSIILTAAYACFFMYCGSSLVMKCAGRGI